MKQELEVAKSEQAMKKPVCKSVYPDKRKKMQGGSRYRGRV